MADVSWSTVALATGPAAITGALGYLGAKLQSRASIRQGEIALAQQAGGFAEEHLRHRKNTYHELLDYTRQLDLMLLSRKPSDNYQEWWERWMHQYNGASMYGTEDVRRAAQALNDVFAEVAEMGDDAAIGNGWPGVRPRYVDALSALVDAMRADVAPPGR